MYLVKPTWIILVIMALGLGLNQPVAATASFTINPITLSEEEVANHDYVLKLNSPDSPLSYCTGQIDLDFYFTLTLSKGLVWDTSIHSKPCVQHLFECVKQSTRYRYRLRAETLKLRANLLERL